MSTREEKENEIVNRHVAVMFEELDKAGFKPVAILAFVVFEGAAPDTFDYNIATTGLDGAFETAGDSPEEQRAELMAYVAVQLGKHLRLRSLT